MQHLDDIRARQFAESRLAPTEQLVIVEHVRACQECQAKVAKAKAEHESADATIEPAQLSAKEAGGLLNGTRAGRYLILEMLGQGGMGVVYSAYDPDLDRKVALKLLHAEGGDATEYRARLLREAQAMARLSHPNVVAVHDAGMLDDRLFLAMEMVEGLTLSRWLRKEPRPWAQIRDVFIGAAQGLHAAHLAGLVHRDFKPANVLVGPTGRVWVTDFGLARSAETLIAAAAALGQQLGPAGAEDIAPNGAGKAGVMSSEFAEAATKEQQIAPKIVDPPSSPTTPPSSPSHPSHLSDSLTRPGVVMGTPAYMAPEQLAGLTVDARSDQYSFSVSMYEALYGERPRLTPEIVKGEKAFELPVPKRDGGPSWLRRAVVKGLSVRPSDRYASMEAFVQAIAVSPYKKAQQVLLALGVVALVVGALSLAWWIQGAPRRRCDAAAEREAIWGGEQRAKVSSAILATKKSWAPAAWTSVQKALDDYSQAWASAQTDACLAYEVGAKDRAVSSPRLDCLAERKEELAATVNLLGATTAEALEKNTSAVQSITPLEGCARIELASTRPTDVKMATARATLRPKLARAKALFEAGQFQPSLAAARDALDEARAANDPGLTADAEYAVAMALDKTGDLNGAAKMLLDAAIDADASHRDDTAARAYTWRIYVLAYEQQKPDEGVREERHARAAISRVGGSAELEGALENALGAIYRASNDNQGAIEHYTKALHQLESAFGSDSPRIAGPMNNLSISLVGLDRFEEAEKLMQRSMDIRIKTFGEGHPSIGAVYNNMAELAARRGQFEKAIELSKKGQALFEVSQGPDHPYVMISLNMQGMVLTHLGRFQEALAVHELALEKRTRVMGAKHPWRAYDLTGVGKAKLGLGDPAGALAPLEEAMALREAAKGQDPRDIAETKLALARTLDALKKEPERVKRLASEADEAFRKNGRRVGSVTEAGEWLSGR